MPYQEISKRHTRCDGGNDRYRRLVNKLPSMPIDVEHWVMRLNAPLAELVHFEQSVTATRAWVEATNEPCWRPKSG